MGVVKARDGQTAGGVFDGVDPMNPVPFSNLWLGQRFLQRAHACSGYVQVVQGVLPVLRTAGSQALGQTLLIRGMILDDIRGMLRADLSGRS